MPAPSPDDVPGLPARRAALKLLDAVLRRGEPMDAVAPNATRDLPPADRALAIAIAGEICRHLPDLDALIDTRTAQPLGDDLKARMVLRIALAQLLLLGTPAHAALATTLPLVSGGPRRLVHGVVGTVLRDKATLPAPPHLPAEVAERWGAQWGETMVMGARVAVAAPPPLDLSLSGPADTAAWADRLGGVSLMPGHIRLQRGTNVAAIDGFAEGDWWVQDLAAALPARLLGAGEGRRVLDIGAAPGGKTMQLAAAGWDVTALDSSAKRAERLRANLSRTGLEATIEVGDARRLDGQRQWDAVLLDAPCSATGIFRRHPDVLHRITPAAIADRAALQDALIAHAAGAVRPGGTLVYATCSLEAAEGEEVIARWLDQRPGWSIDPVRADELPAGVAPDALGQVRLMPPMLQDAGGLDGFFMARLRRDG